MNIQFQLCGLFILILFFVFYKSHKTLQLYKERLFYEVLCTLIIVLILDISSLIAINERASMPLIMVNAVCKMYLMSLIWATRSALVYILTDILPEKEHRKITTYITVITIVQSIMTTHHGTVEALNVEGGVCMSVKLPYVASSSKRRLNEMKKG